MSARLHTTEAAAAWDFDRTLTVSSSDNEDHTFCGIMFTMQCSAKAPATSLKITQFSIRGQLGPISVYTTKKYVPHDHKGIHSNQGAWERVAQHNFEILHRPWTSYRDIVLDVPVDLPPGEQRGFYIHSTLSNDQAIVYDNHYTYNGAPNDEFVKVLPGMAHLSNQAFSANGGMGWGTWRNPRTFVGCVEYGVKTVLWTRRNNELFNPTFRVCASAFYMMHALSWSGLPADCVDYILNMLNMDWFSEAKEEMEARKSMMGRAALAVRRYTVVSTVRRRLSFSKKKEDVEEEEENSANIDPELLGESIRRKSVACSLM